MPTFIYKLGDDEYVEWSSVVDAPVSHLMTRDEMFEHLFDRDAGTRPEEEETERRKIEARLQRADATGTSFMWEEEPRTPAQLVAYNRAGPREGKLSYKALMAALRAEREEFVAQLAKRKAEQERIKMQFLARSGDLSQTDVFGILSAAGVITWRDRRVIDQSHYTITDIFEGGWRVEDEAWVMAMFKRWNQALGAKYFIEESGIAEMMQTIDEELGMPVTSVK